MTTTLAAVTSLAVLLPALRWAARRDTHPYGRISGVFRDEHHALGLFLLVGLLAATPALVAAVASRRHRALNLAAASACLLLAAICEGFVYYSTW